MRRDLPFDEIADAVGLSTPAFAEKDYYVVQALAAVCSLDPSPFQLIFAGGTCLTKAHRVTQRMSEDIDLKIALPPDITLQGNPLRAALRQMRAGLCNALLEAEFQFDPRNEKHVIVRNQGQLIRINLDYTPFYTGESQLRPHIQIEAAFRPPKLAPVEKSVLSFAAEALGEPPELDQICCIAISETAAEKLVGLLWRVFSKSINEGPAYNADDDRLVRHIYDLHKMAVSLNADEVVELAREVARHDADERRGQAPTFAENPEDTLVQAVGILTADPRYAAEYDEFATAMIYGDKPPFDDAVATVADLAHRAWGR